MEQVEEGLHGGSEGGHMGIKGMVKRGDIVEKVHGGERCDQ